MLPLRSTRAVAAATVLGVVLSSCTVGALRVSKMNALPLRSTIRDANGEPLGTVYEVNRAKVEYDKIPPHVRNAFIAAEDERFWIHDGVDVVAIGRAAWANLRAGRTQQGASTITMQLAKLLYAEPLGARTFEQKIFEARIARDLESRFTKQQILENYLNRAYFGNRAYGIRAAAESFFGKYVKDLTIAEGALLAGLVKAPTTYNPFKRMSKAKTRRRYVLRRMLALDMISTHQIAKARVEAIRLRRVDYTETIKKPYWVEYIEREALRTRQLGANEESRARQLYRGGLQIKTTLDPRWQKWAEQAVKLALPYESDPEAAVVAIDVETGAIKAMVGGRNFQKDQFDIASQGMRQPGSAFKPFVMAAALEQGISPESRYASAPTTLNYHGTIWKVDNYDSADRGILTLRQGMMASVNGVYARLMMKVGAPAVVDVAQRLGIRTAQLDPYPAIALGGLTYGVTPLEMASAYATMASGGVYHRPHGIQRISDRHGETMFDDSKIVPEQVFDPNLAYALTGMLKDVACCGTGVHAKIARPMAAKTGTTNSLKDAWLVGYTKHVALAVWVGYRKPTAMFNVRGIKVVGGSFPSQIWRYFMERAEAEYPYEDWADPPGYAQLNFVNGSRESCRTKKGDLSVLDPASTVTRCKPTASPEPSPTRTGPRIEPDPTPTRTRTPKPTPTKTKTPKPTPDPTPTETPTPDPTPIETPTPDPTPTETPTPDPTESGGGGGGGGGDG
jgi:penicillin-binding protein 1A